MHPHRFLPFSGAALLLAVTILPIALRAQVPTLPGGAPPALPGTPPPLPSLPGIPPPPPRFVPPRLPPNPRFNAPGAPGAPAVPGGPVLGEEMSRVYYPSADVKDILEHYAVLTGKRVLPDNTVQGQISIVVNQTVPKSEAIRIIEVALNLNGFTLVQDGDNIVKVLGLGKQPRNEGVPIFSELEQLPANTEQIVSYLFRPRYLDPQEIAGALQQYVPPINRAAFTPLEKAGALLITDTAVSVRRLVGLLTTLDQPASPVVERYFRLDRADATKALEFLNTLFDTKNAATGASTGAASGAGAGNRRTIRRAGEEGVPNAEPTAQNVALANGSLTLSGDSLIQGHITLSADVRTNTVYVITSPVNIPLVEQLLNQYDADTPFATPIRRPLRYVSAKDVLPILVQALAEPGSDANGGTNGTSGNTGSSTGRTSVNNNSTASNSSSNSPFSSLSGSSSSGSGSGSSGSANIGESGLDTPAVDTTPTIATVGNTKLIADQRSNTIILLGGAEAKDKVFETLDQLDVRAPQVVIRTVIGELSLTKDSELGFNYLLRTNRGSIFSSNSAAFATGTTAATTATTATGTSTTTGTVTTGTTAATGTASNLSQLTDLATGLAGAGSSFSGVGGIIAIGKSFEVILSALESTTRFKTLSRPMIFTSNNKKAIIASGQEIAVPTSQVGTSTGSVAGTVGTYTNVDYKDVTLQLEVVPLINSEHEITLDILQKIDSLVGNGAGTTVNGTVVPTIATRYLKTTVSAPNNSTIVLGGLITQDENKSSGDIPYLSKIPVIGNLFKARTTDADRSELIILMHPEVVNTPALLAQVNKNEARRTYLGSDLEGQLLPMQVRKAIPVKKPKPTPTPVPMASK